MKLFSDEQDYLKKFENLKFQQAEERKEEVRLLGVQLTKKAFVQQLLRFGFNHHHFKTKLSRLKLLKCHDEHTN